MLTREGEFLKVHFLHDYLWALVGEVAYIHQVDLQKRRLIMEWEWEG